ncbi:cupin domain-containing protein [Nocardioides nitrophenolicus]|uniref:cupin domain-containing protein n=1 Tax=Nocardioides nitrophenolicus TaxID=60489 RepID=UPI0019584D2C|nr:cupin domain-containing protein [Nocardioides nitrophenolicus]MBM7519898.1 transcriptional regulator with XRE-family HTH domain [Nocardioides nitrophenolicus]
MTDDAASDDATSNGTPRASRRRAAAGGLGASVGQNVRAERKRQGISVRELARRLGVSASFLSQFELGQSKAAVNTLFAIASELNLSLDELLGSSVEAPRPSSERRPALSDKDGAAEFAEYLTLQNGVRWKRLADTPPDHHVQFLLTEYEPGADSAPGDAPQRHPGDDYGYVLEGTLTIEVDGTTRTLGAGESIHLRGDVPHRLHNLSDELVRAIWFVVS